MDETIAHAKPLSAVPDDLEIAGWDLLSRDEQLQRLREHLRHPECAIVTDDTMDDILAAARRRAADRNA